MESRNIACNMEIGKLEVENAEGTDNDRISNLPNELRQQILCFLPTKDAVRTSILSKKWEYLWTYIDVLEFTCFPRLKMVMSMNWRLGVPNLICFPRLKILILKNVIFSDHDAAYRLFHGCPVLETLCIHDCNWLKLSAITISSSTLQSLQIRENTTRNRSNASRCQVMLHCESLKSFRFEGELKTEYSLSSVPSLVDACVCIAIPNWAGRQLDITFRLKKLLVELSSVTSLTLSSVTVEVQGYAKRLFTRLPEFDKLTRFTLCLGLHELDFGLANLLIKFPRLEYLALAEGIFIREENVDRMLNVVSSRVWSNLKSIEVGCFKGSKGEVSAVGMLLKIAPVLESLVIYCDKFLFYDMMKRESVREVLLMLPRSSLGCKVVLSF